MDTNHDITIFSNRPAPSGLEGVVAGSILVSLNSENAKQNFDLGVSSFWMNPEFKHDFISRMSSVGLSIKDKTEKSFLN